MVKLLFTILMLQLAATIGARNDKPAPPHPPKSGIKYFNDVTPVPCTTNDSATSSGSGDFNYGIMNGMVDTKYRWTAFNVYLDESYTNEERSNINDVMFTLSEILPCISFGIWPRNSSPTGDYVHIIRRRNNGCSSYCGRQGGRQIMNLQSPGCMHKGTITHEFLHALGLHHEHGRPDRDDYIDIQWQNVESGMEHAFQKYSPEIVSSFGVPYNIKSIMHYDNLAFTKNGEYTILAKVGNTSEVRDMGSLELQESDIEKVQRMYNCSTSSSEEE